MLLRNYPECRAASVHDARFKLDLDAPGSDLQLAERQGKKPLSFRVNIVRLSGLALVWATSNYATSIRSAPAGVIKQVFQLRGSSRLRWGGSDVTNKPDSSSCLIPADEMLQVDSTADYQSLSLRIAPSILQSKLSALMGQNVEVPVFEYGRTRDDRAMQSLRRATLQLVGELDELAPSLPPSMLDEVSEALVIRFLIFHRHSYSDRLHRTAASPSEQQVRRIEDYIRNNWSSPLDIEKMAKALDLSGRTIFRTLNRARGYSPSDLLRQVRLDKAQMMLLGTDEASVLTVALKCGFHSFGHFSRAYRERFGELPSNTLRKARSTSYKRHRVDTADP